MKHILFSLLSLATVSSIAVSPTVESQITSMLPNTKISQINAGPFDGTYEVLAANNAFYVSLKNESEIIVGHVVNIKTMQDITQNHLEALTAQKVNFKNLPLDKALKVGKGKKQMVVFIDPDCPYCQQLEAFLHDKLDKVTIYYMFMPLAMHPNALPHTKQIMCSGNPEQAVFKVMVSHQELAMGSKSCQEKVDKNIEEISKFAMSNGINSTPYIITDSNQVIGGFNVPQLQAFIDGGK